MILSESTSLWDSIIWLQKYNPKFGDLKLSNMISILTFSKNVCCLVQNRLVYLQLSNKGKNLPKRQDAEAVVFLKYLYFCVGLVYEYSWIKNAFLFFCRLLKRRTSLETKKRVCGIHPLIGNWMFDNFVKEEKKNLEAVERKLKIP